MKFRVTSKIDLEMIVRRAHKADLVLTIQAMKDTNKFVPFRTGSLSNRTNTGKDSENDTHLADGAKEQTEKAVRAGKPLIIYPGPYAHYLYEGKLYVDPKTGSSWAGYGEKKVITDKNLVFSQTSGHKDAQAHWFEASKAVNMEKWKRVYGKALDREK